MSKEQNYTFKSITLKTSKLSEQYHFYVEKLGLQCITRTGNAFSISCGKTTLTFEKYIQNAQYHFAFNIPQNQIDDACAWLKQYTEIIQFEGQDIVDFPNWNAHSLYFKDAAGNIVEFIARHNLDNDNDQKFCPDSIIEISEVGLPTEDISAMFKKIKDEFGFGLFWGDMENFAAIGHEKCLFITVPLERTWFPTDDTISKIWPLEVKLGNERATKKVTRVESDYIFTK